MGTPEDMCSSDDALGLRNTSKGVSALKSNTQVRKKEFSMGWSSVSRVILAMAFFATVVRLPAQEYGANSFGGPIQTEDCPSTSVQVRPSAQVTYPDYVELSRSVCYGTCPDYTVRIGADGKVVWHGRYFVSRKGEMKSQVDSEKAVALIEKFRKQGFWGLCGRYSRSITDNPTYSTVVMIDGKTKKVEDYAVSAPKWLQDLDKEIDDLAGTKRWIGVHRIGEQP
jgi:hypothetical protein